MLKKSGIEVWDRLDLILKIFAKHAKTTEARLEIELASIRHMGPRIYDMGMEMSRQGDGVRRNFYFCQNGEGTQRTRDRHR